MIADAFVRRDGWPELCADNEPLVDAKSFDTLARLGILPVFASNDSDVALLNDIKRVACKVDVEPVRNRLFKQVDEGFATEASSYLFNPSTECWFEITTSGEIPALTSSFGPAVGELIDLARRSRNDLGDPVWIDYLGSSKLWSRSNDVVSRARDQVARSTQASSETSTLFSNSAYYMGSKRTLAAFLLQSLEPVLRPDEVLLDLMCGSGAASRAFSTRYTTIASDAMEFCTTLASSLGGGQSLERAREILAELGGHIAKNASSLSSLVGDLIQAEDRFFHAELDELTLTEYARFVESTPLFPGELTSGGWNPAFEIHRRRESRDIEPYCMTLGYFANVFFGLRQAVEIDSIRFAIDQLSSAAERRAALGALVATCSVLGTGYAGQFAQPRALKRRDLPALIMKRAVSPLHEFSARFLALAAESAKAERVIETITAPWRTTIALMTGRATPHMTVYVDAPYTRDEYSRYYHVLETVVKYDYPTSCGKSRSPCRGSDRFFASPFFTKSTTRLTRELVQLILTILSRGWRCAWSYSSTAMADIVDIVERVTLETRCSVSSTAATHGYKGQGGRGPRAVTEYVIIFEPTDAHSA